VRYTSISYSPYELFTPYKLNWKSLQKRRVGFLIRVTFEDGITGFADCHPWIELGDADVNVQKDALKKKFLTPLLQQSLKCAYIDGLYRSQKKNLLDGLVSPINHLLIGSLSSHWNTLNGIQNFKTLKVKWNGALPLEEHVYLLKAIAEKKFIIRLDCNGFLSQQLFLSFLNKIKPFKEAFEFIEDPISEFDPDFFAVCQNNFQILIALDRLSLSQISLLKAKHVLVLKPAVQDIDNYLQYSSQHKIVITSYLDHPIGQLYAAYHAAKLYSSHSKALLSCGLLSHRLYTNVQGWLEEKNFSINSQGTGLGCDNKLDTQDWVLLC
jgi:O-succinylbenzoate synthase